jgi:hypothetical protein
MNKKTLAITIYIAIYAQHAVGAEDAYGCVRLDSTPLPQHLEKHTGDHLADGDGSRLYNTSQVRAALMHFYGATIAAANDYSTINDAGQLTDKAILARRAQDSVVQMSLQCCDDERYQSLLRSLDRASIGFRTEQSKIDAEYVPITYLYKLHSTLNMNGLLRALGKAIRSMAESLPPPRSPSITAVLLPRLEDNNAYISQIPSCSVQNGLDRVLDIRHAARHIHQLSPQRGEELCREYERALCEMITAAYGNPACDQTEVAMLQEARGQIEYLSNQYLVPEEGRSLQTLSRWRNSVTNWRIERVNQKIGDCIARIQEHL